MKRPLILVAVFGAALYLAAPAVALLFNNTILATSQPAPVAPPGPIPTAIAPTSGTIFDNAGSGQTIQTFSVTMSDGSAFSGTTSELSESYSSGLATLSGLTLKTSRALSSADDGTDNIGVQACQNGGCTSISYALSITAPGAQIACGIGPPVNGPIPAPAVALGFTTCAINLDFSYTGNFTANVYNTDSPGHVYNWSNTNSWLSPFGGPPSPYGSYILWCYSDRCDASHYAIINDPTSNGTNGSHQVLQISEFPSDGCGSSCGIMGASTLPYPSTNSFMEEIIKVDPNIPNYINSSSGGGGAVETVDEYGLWTNQGSQGNGIEFDNIICNVYPGSHSWNVDPCQIGGISWNNNGNINPEPVSNGISMVDGNWHKKGILWTASANPTPGSTPTPKRGYLGVCGYTDQQYDKTLDINIGNVYNTNQNCGSFGHGCAYPDNVLSQYACKQMGQLQIGSAANWSNYNGPVLQTVQHWVQRITIWTCASWYSDAAHPVATSNQNSCDSGDNVYVQDHGPSY